MARHCVSICQTHGFVSSGFANTVYYDVVENLVTTYFSIEALCLNLVNSVISEQLRGILIKFGNNDHSFEACPRYQKIEFGAVTLLSNFSSKSFMEQISVHILLPLNPKKWLHKQGD